MFQDSKIELTEVEEKICDLFDKCTTYLKEEKNITTSCRFAGGWVRDKLLGLESNDIDVALSDMMGYPFAEHLAEYAKTQGIHTGSIGKVAMNPNQSKHLETATFNVYGLSIDLVNLRSEEYASNSRIPTEVPFGTPLQDALRRDITINALFYNVHTRTVEDLTGKGLEDLENGIIRTPLPPRETFLDDPLRVLRCIRFSSRFGFKIVREVTDAIKDPVVTEALIAKVSRDRVGEELAKMIKGSDPLRSIQLISALSLYDPVFSVIPSDVASTISPPSSPSIDALKAATVLHTLIQPIDSERHPSLPTIHPTLIKAANDDPSCKPRLFMAAVLTPYLGVNYQDKKKKTLPLVTYILRETLRLGTQNHYLDGIPALFSATDILKNPDLENNRFKQPSQRVAIGTLLREKLVHNTNTGSHWTSSLLFSLVQELVPHFDITSQTFDDNASQVINTYNSFIKCVEELNLADVVDAKPLLDGREVVKYLDAKPGPWTGQVLAQVMEWQLQNPEGTKEACIDWLKAAHASGKLKIEEKSSEPALKKAKTKR